jgi:hypothetical protein
MEGSLEPVPPLSQAGSSDSVGVAESVGDVDIHRTWTEEAVGAGLLEDFDQPGCRCRTIDAR